MNLLKAKQRLHNQKKFDAISYAIFGFKRQSMLTKIMRKLSKEVLRELHSFINIGLYIGGSNTVEVYCL